ncbi:MAG: AraC family transcriptional regulator, partial [Bacteroidota bacterium]
HMLETEEGLVMRCGNYLNNFFATEGSTSCEAIAVHFYPDVLKMIYDKELPDFLLHLNKVKPLPITKYQASELMASYINSLQFYFENPALVSDELLKLKLKELILLLAKTDNAAAIQSLMASMFKPSEIDFKAVIEANLYNNCSMEELATLTNLSLSSFKREFARQYDCSPAKYIRRRKMQKAAKLLKGTDLRISDIAFDCGFKDLAHFSKAFQKHYAFSPSDYRVN